MAEATVKAGADGIERVLVEIKNRLDGLENRLDRLEQKMEGEIGELKNRLDGLEQKMEGEIGALKTKLELMDISHKVLWSAVRRSYKTEGEEFEELRDSFVSDPSGFNSTKWILGRKI